MPEQLTPIRRPNGKLYRPRKLRSFYCEDDYTGRAEVLVLGTHTQSEALPLASAEANFWVEGGGVLDVIPEPGWWRDGFECGERAWIWDEVSGAAGLRFEISA